MNRLNRTIPKLLRKSWTHSVVCLPVELLEKLFRFREQIGQYDKAENVLYDILEVKPEFKAEAMLFYKRLLEKKDEELSQGGLPRRKLWRGWRAQEWQLRHGKTHIRRQR